MRYAGCADRYADRHKLRRVCRVGIKIVPIGDNLAMTVGYLIGTTYYKLLSRSPNAQGPGYNTQGTTTLFMSQEVKVPSEVCHHRLGKRSASPYVAEDEFLLFLDATDRRLPLSAAAL